jgi:protein-tyrosine phosphatase
MGEYLLKEMVKQSSADIVITSAGLGALVGHEADEFAREVMTEKGIDISVHRARQLEGQMIKNNDLILVMESWQQKEIEDRFPFSRGRVHLMGKWNDSEINDPYKKSKEHFIDAFDKINQSCKEWCDRLC